MKQYYIYKITNLIDNKVYVGQHLSNKDMMIGDKYMGSGLIIKQAIKKYGIENFRRDILACTSTRKNSDILEKYYIGLARELYDCYNIADGGQGGDLGEEVNNKISKALKGHSVSEETKSKISESNKGRFVSEEAKLNMSKAKKGKYCGIENHNYGKHLTEETKLKISKTKKINYHKEDNPMYGKHHSEVTRNKISKARKGKCCGKDNYFYGKHHSEESKLKNRNSHLGKKASIETKQKLSKFMKGRYCGEKNPMYGKPAANRIRVLCVELNIIFDSLKDAKEYVGLRSSSSIGDVLKGRYSTAGGYHWEYAD